jgi:hypothetical protein
MSMKAIIGIVVGLAVVGGLAWFVTKDKGEASKETAGEAPKELSSGSFADLMARGGNTECEATAIHEEGSSTGTVKMSDGKLRGDFVAIVGGRTVSTSFVHRDGFVYTWSDLMPQGFKVKAEAAEGTAGGQGIDPSTNVEYSCAPWTPDESEFELPSDITFIDVSAMSGAGAAVPQ